MNAAALSPDAARLKEVRASFLQIAPARWSRAHDENGALIEATTGSGERFVLARIEPAASLAEEIFLADAADMVGFLLRLLDDAFTAIRAFKAGQALDEANAGEAARPKNYAAECALKCADFTFQRFLEARHGLEPPLDADRAAQKVRSILGITSRAELNDDGKAAAAWRALRAAYERHKRGRG